MKEILQSIFATTKEKISNPIMGTFVFSWIAFNWKPILFIVISNQTIENKFTFIDLKFSNIYNLLVFPIIAVVFYILAIPYINLLFEYLLEFSRVKRNFISVSKQKQLIENNKELAIEEIKFEEAKAEFKERKNHNKHIEDLNKIIQDKDSQLQIERERFLDLNKKIKHESTYLNERFQEDKNDFELKIKLMEEENSILREKFTEAERKYFKILHNEKLIRDEEGNLFSENGKKIRLEHLTDIERRKLIDKGFL